MSERDPDMKEGYPYYAARGSSQPQQQEPYARADAQPSHFGDYGERQQPSRIACCLSCRNCYFYQTDENQTLCPACSNDAMQFEPRQRLILCPTCRSILTRPDGQHAAAICGRCQSVLTFPMQDPGRSTPSLAGSNPYQRPPPGFGYNQGAQAMQHVIAVTCPTCQVIVQAPLGVPMCKCGNCGQLMRVPTSIV